MYVNQGAPGDPSEAWLTALGHSTIDTYSASVVGYTPGSAATDVLTIAGAAGKVVRVTRVGVSGFSTSGAVIAVCLIKRSAADTSGTPNAMTAVPHNKTSPAAVATVNNWTSTPPSVGTAVGTIRASRLGISAAAATTPGDRIEWTFENRPGKAIELFGTADVLAINLNGATLAGGELLDMDIEWTEATA
jgi:hypothetical protein